MRVALYARVSTEAQQVRGTIGSQLEALRARAADEGDEVVAELVDDGYSGARLDRPGLDGLRDAAEAGVVEGVWCLSPDRLARVYAWQVLVLDELARLGVAVRFVDAPALDDDPQARLLTQVQGVIAEYERAKIAERYRRGKLWRSRAGEVISWKAPYGYRRVPRGPAGPAHLAVYEPEAQVVRRIFDDYVTTGLSMRQLTRQLNTDRIPSPTGKPVWGVSTVGRLLRNQAYVGRVYYNRTELVPAPTPGRRPTRQRPRASDEWVQIAVPAVVGEDLFDAARRGLHWVLSRLTRWAEPGAWLLRGLVVCGACGVGANCHKMRGRNGTWHRYYYCRNHDPLRAGGEHRRCPERNIRADELDTFVFDQVRAALLRPQALLAGQAAVTARQPTPDDELLCAQLARLQRKLDAAHAERRRLVDLYQAGLLGLTEVGRRAAEVDTRRQQLAGQQAHLAAERGRLAEDNQLRQRLTGFAERVTQAFDGLDYDQRQRLLRLVVEHVRVTGQQVEIHLRIPLDEPPNHDPPALHPTGPTGPATDMRLRSLGGEQRPQLPAQGSPQALGRRWCPRVTMLAQLPTYEPVPETTSALDPGHGRRLLPVGVRGAVPLTGRPRLLRPAARPRRDPPPGPAGAGQPAGRHPARLPAPPHPLRRAQGLGPPHPASRSLTATNRGMSRSAAHLPVGADLDAARRNARRNKGRPPQPGGRSWAARFMRLRRHSHISTTGSPARAHISRVDRQAASASLAVLR